MKRADERKGVLVEEVIEVIDVLPEAIQLSKQEAAYSAGIVSLGESVASVISIDQIIF